MFNKHKTEETKKAKHIEDTAPVKQPEAPVIDKNAAVSNACGLGIPQHIVEEIILRNPKNIEVFAQLVK